jgi:hypothetical protein
MANLCQRIIFADKAWASLGVVSFCYPLLVAGDELLRAAAAEDGALAGDAPLRAAAAEDGAPGGDEPLRAAAVEDGALAGDAPLHAVAAADGRPGGDEPPPAVAAADEVSAAVWSPFAGFARIPGPLLCLALDAFQQVRFESWPAPFGSRFLAEQGRQASLLQVCRAVPADWFLLLESAASREEALSLAAFWEPALLEQTSDESAEPGLRVHCASHDRPPPCQAASKPGALSLRRLSIFPEAQRY